VRKSIGIQGRVAVTRIGTSDMHLVLCNAN
jgi:hypothetical protein